MKRKTPAQAARAWLRENPGSEAAPVVKALLAEHRTVRAELVKLSNAALGAIAEIDTIMAQQPPAVDRGRAVVKVVNALELANDGARHFHLGAGITGERRPAR